MVGTSGNSLTRSRGAGRDHLHAAFAVQRQRGRRRIEHQVDMAGDEIVHGEAQAPIWHQRRLDPAEHFKLHGCEMSDRADPRRRRGDLAGRGLGALDQVLDRRAFEILAHHEHIGSSRQQRDRGPARRIERHVLVEEAVGRDRPRRSDHHRVTVRRRPEYLRRADIAGSAAKIFDHDRLTPFAAELVGDQPADGVGAAAGGIGDHDADGAAWERILRRAPPPVAMAAEQHGQRRTQNISARMLSSPVPARLTARRCWHP